MLYYSLKIKLTRLGLFVLNISVV